MKRRITAYVWCGAITIVFVFGIIWARQAQEREADEARVSQLVEVGKQIASLPEADRATLVSTLAALRKLNPDEFPPTLLEGSDDWTYLGYHPAIAKDQVILHEKTADQRGKICVLLASQEARLVTPDQLETLLGK